MFSAVMESAANPFDIRLEEELMGVKLTVIGGGGVRSMFLARSLVCRAEELDIQEIVFMDNNETKLRIFGEMARQVAKKIRPEITFELTSDPVFAVKDADFVITTIRVGEDEKRVDDERIALNHGILGQETTGAAGFSFAMRSVPELAKYCELIQAYASPEVKVFNFTNPAGVVSQTLRDMGYDFTYGICDAPSGLLRSLAGLYGERPEDIQAECYGLNHLSFFNSIRFQGKEVLDILMEDDRIYTETDMRFFSKELTREMGCLLNEYLYYYFFREKAVENIQKAGLTRGELIRDVNRHMIEELSELDVEKEFSRCLEIYDHWHGYRSEMYMKNETGISRKEKFHFDVYEKDDGGYAGVALNYIRAIQTGNPVDMILCVPNQGAIEGLRDDDVVEVTCHVSKDGCVPHKIDSPGTIPMELCRRVKLYERYASEAIRKKSRSAAVKCLFVHPLVNSWSLAEKLVDEYLESNKDYVEGWK